MARIEFDPQQLTINGDKGVRSSDIVPGGSYLLALNGSRFNLETASLWVQQVIPLVRIDVHDAGISTEVLSGIVGIEHREVGAQSRWLDYSGVIGWEIDLTPWREATRDFTLTCHDANSPWFWQRGASRNRSVPPPVALSPSTSPTATPAADLSVTDPGLILVVVVIPVVLVSPSSGWATSSG